MLNLKDLFLFYERKIHMKKWISLLLMFAICFSVFSNNVLANSSFTEETNPKPYITKRLMQNIDIMNEVFETKDKEQYDEKSYIELKIPLDKKTVELTLSYGGNVSATTLYGTYSEVKYADSVGYVAVYEGFISPIPNRTLALSSDGKVPLIVDITFTDSDAFAALTLGYATETLYPDIIFFGDYSAQIANISNANAVRSLEEAQIKKIVEVEETTSKAVDGTCKFQGYDSIYFGSKIVGVLSVFHADELRNQGNMSTYVKINTKSTAVKNYIKDDLGFGSNTMMAYPDTFNVSVCGNNNNFHAVTNSYTPQNNSTSATINIPIYAGSVVGLQFIPLDITMSSTTVTPSKYSSSSPHLNNKISWEIYKRNGWNPNTFDGGYTSDSGMSVASTYTYEGNVTSNISRNMTSTGSIRYEYWISILGNLSSYHLSTGTMSKTTSVTICP